MDMLKGKKLISKDGALHSIKKLLKNKKILIYYFSSSYVDKPELVQQLKLIYQENIKRGIGMEIIYVSSDIDEKTFNHDFIKEQGPWLAVPFKDPLAHELRYRYDISSLPTIIVVNMEDGEIITRKGRQELEQIGINVIVTWSEYTQ